LAPQNTAYFNSWRETSSIEIAGLNK